MTDRSGRLAGKVALIIGAARGIGAGIAERFHEEGAKVVIGDTEAEAGAATAARLEGQVRRNRHIEPADAEGAVAASAAGLWRSRHRGPERRHLSLVADREHLAGRMGHGLGVNLRGVFLIARAALPHMKAKALRADGVYLVDHRSPRHQSGPWPLFRLQGRHQRLHQSAALEFSAYDITVNGVEPGNILTESIEKQRSEAFVRGMVDSIPLGRLGTPRDVAQATLFLASDEAAYITGTTIVVDGGQTCPRARTSARAGVSGRADDHFGSRCQAADVP